MKTGESLARDIASLRIDGQNGADLVAGDEKQSVLGERAKHLPIKGDADLRGPSRLGEVKPVSVRHVHGAPDLQASDHGHRIDVSRAYNRSAPLDSVADVHTSTGTRGEVLRIQPLPMALSLFGIFPNLPPTRSATVQPWAPKRFAKENPEPMRDEDILGVGFDLLTAIRPAGRNAHGWRMFLCRCKCGAECVKSGQKLLGGIARACRNACPMRRLLVNPSKVQPTSARSQQQYRAKVLRIARRAGGDT